MVSDAGAQISRRDRKRGGQFARYDLSLRVLPDAHRLEVSGSLRLPSNARRPTEIQLSLSELMGDFKVEVVRPVASAGKATLEKVKVENGEATWAVHPPRPFRGGEAVELRFSCAGGGQISSIFYIGPEACFASAYGTNWYPLVVGGNNRGTGSLRIAVPAGEKAISEGRRLSSPAEEAEGIFLFENNHPTYFSFASGKYTVVRRGGRIPVSAYLLRTRPNMEQYLEGVPKILDVLAGEFGPYPYEEFTLVEVPRELARQASFNAATVQGLAFINSNAFNLPATEFDGILEWYGHEFSHMWWPNTVAIRRPGGRYIEEALAEYGGLRVVEALAGPAAAEQYRRTGYRPDPIYSALEYFKLAGAGFDYQLADLPAGTEAHNIAYNKGFLVWDMLAREVGRENFRRALRGITARHAFRELTLNEFWRAIEAGAGGRDLGWFYEQWFERKGAPEWQLTWKQEGDRVSGAITQAAPFYRATLEVGIQGDAGQYSTHSVKVSGARTEFSLPVRFRAQSVALDPHYLVLRWTPEYRKAAEAARSARPSGK
jgi:hypothetical protein